VPCCCVHDPRVPRWRPGPVVRRLTSSP
jgi:hypothetical protein